MTAPNPLRALSVSRAEKFDHAQYGGCERRSWFEEVHDLKPEQSAGQEDGVKGHALLATYLSTGQAPQGRVKMGKAVTGAILKGEIPAPGPDLRVEQRFDGQAQYDATGAWIPLRPETTLHLAGIPWDGFIDLRFRRGALVEIWDHKFSTDIHERAKQVGPLIATIQMPVYALDSLRVWPDATEFRLVHHYVSRKGVESFIRSKVVTLDQVLERKEQIEGIARRMQAARSITSQGDVPFNRKSCDAYSGCPHQSICTAFKEKRLALSAEEIALFADLDDLTPTAKPPPAREPGTDDADALDAVAPGAASAAVPPPAASTPRAQAPVAASCGDCGTTLKPGETVHAGCPLAAVDASGGVPASTAVQGAVYQLPDGHLAKFSCGTNGGYSFRHLTGGAPVLLPGDARVVPTEAPAQAGKLDPESPALALAEQKAAEVTHFVKPGQEAAAAEHKADVTSAAAAFGAGERRKRRTKAEMEAARAAEVKGPGPIDQADGFGMAAAFGAGLPIVVEGATLPTADTDGDGAPVNPPEPTRDQIPDSRAAAHGADYWRGRADAAPVPATAPCAPAAPAGFTITVSVELGPQTMALLGKLLSR